MLLFLPLSQASTADFNKYTKKLIALGKLDQQARGSNFYSKESMQIDEKNLIELKRLIKKYGFPEISKVGKEAYFSAFLVAQHAGHDLDFMKSFFSDVEKRLNTGEVINKTYGYLFDRINRMEGKAQVYGTQGKCIENKYVPSRPISITDLDQKRATIGLLSMDAFSKEVCHE